MDGVIGRWVLEFLIRECTNAGVAPRLLSNASLPFPAADGNSRLKKTIVLRSIQDELGKGSVSEDILDWLENLEEIDRRDGISVSESMKLAYCAVAVECTLRIGGEIKEAVDRIWKVRIQRLVGKSELVTGEVPMLRLAVEMAVRDSSAHTVVQKWREEHNALKLVGDYLDEAFGIMGPSFLQVVAMKQMEMENQNGDGSGGRVNGIVNGEERACNDDGSGDAECEVIPNVNANSAGVLDGTVSVEEHLCDVVDDSGKKRKDRNSDVRGNVAGSRTGEEQPVELRDAGGRAEGEDAIKNCEMKKRKGASSSDRRKHVSRRHGPAKIAEVGEFDETGDGGNVGATSSAIGNVQGGKDHVVSPPSPIPTSLPSASDKGKHVSHCHRPFTIADVDETSEVFMEASAPATSNQGVPVVQGGKDHVVSPPSRIPTSLPSASDKGKHVSHCHGPFTIADVDQTSDVFMEASAPATSNQGVPAAQGGKDTHPPQCPIPAVDKQNEKGEGSAACAGNRPQMERHRRVLPAYQKKYEDLNLLPRRKKRKWSSEEETALINGVQEFGPGAWKEILAARRDQFDSRSEVDLKDKWRNMTKFRH